MQIIKVRFLISLAAETAALPGKPGVLGGKFPERRVKQGRSRHIPAIPAPGVFSIPTVLEE